MAAVNVHIGRPKYNMICGLGINQSIRDKRKSELMKVHSKCRSTIQRSSIRRV